MIGLSLTLCIQDIIEGKVPYENVEKLIVGTRFANQSDWDRHIQRFKETCWKNNPAEAERIVRGLLYQGRIEQPRLTHRNRFPLTRWGKKIRWVNSENEIAWNPDNNSNWVC